MRKYQDSRFTTSKFNSTCAGCHRPIRKGTEIVYVPGDGKVYHPECDGGIMDGLRAEKSMDAYGTDIY